MIPAGITKTHDRPVSPVADFRNLRIRSAITSAPDDRPSFSSGLGSIPSGSLGLWFLHRSGQVGAQPSVGCDRSLPQRPVRFVYPK